MIVTSRLAMLALLVCGLMVSGTGAGFAVQGFSGNGNAAQSQYGGDVVGPTLPVPRPGGGVLLEEPPLPPAPAGRVPRPGEPPPPQVERQIEVGAQGGGDELPFTGLAAIPILLLGLAMTVTGLVTRRRIGRDGS